MFYMFYTCIHAHCREHTQVQHEGAAGSEQPDRNCEANRLSMKRAGVTHRIHFWARACGVWSILKYGIIFPAFRKPLEGTPFRKPHKQCVSYKRHVVDKRKIVRARNVAYHINI